ncbi:MAG: bifunctional UDP-N-acetylglucosamine diphosphorylase/glucosamine-1-phosphate N-acetyltransferase GlmU [Diaphorobacter sp.]|nr:bifunctional UDP-N-acetylglucosamine diphosphorylase/glucosamine-1-phosphate N-acetyltransferase GlmU [Diaphorobacter sp.]
MTALDIIIMAAGKGTRMKSRIPKVLQRLAGRPLLHHVLGQAASLQARRVVVVTGHGATEVEAACAGLAGAGGTFDLKFVRQEPQLGTGHAVQQATPALAGDGTVVVLSGDVPLTQAATLRALVEAGAGERLALLTVRLPDPTGYGRIVRGEGGTVQRIVEHKDANDAERAIDEVYSGIMAVPAQRLAGWLARLTNDNAQGEYYLTDIVSMAVADGVPVAAHCIGDALQVAGVNSPAQLAELERAHQRAQAAALMEQGVRLADPARFDLRDDARSGARGEILCAQDVEIDVGCIFTGRVELGEGARIGAYCHISNATIAAGAVVHPFTHIDGEKAGAHVGEGALIGPFARLRPGAQLGREVHIGNFVEVKNSSIAAHSKANHLAYIGDATVGSRVNVGAGTITCNYDGANKHRTVIEDDVFIGSDTQLVAPVTVGRGATLGAGTTLTKDAPPDQLTVSRPKQMTVPGWKRPVKQKKE